jgi:hypothetical protein
MNMTEPSAMVPQVEVRQIWRRKSDGVLVAVREMTGSSHSFTRLQNLNSGRHFEATAPQIRKRYEFVGRDESEMGLDDLADLAFGPIRESS